MLEKIKFLYLTLIILCNCSINSYGQIAIPESSELTVENGLWLFKHKISQGETLYSLSKMYGVSIDDIESMNPATSNGIVENQMILIPVSSQFLKIHEVNRGETLYSIARIYKIRVGELRKWNDLRGNEIAVGQKLQIFMHTENLKKPVSNDGRFHTVLTGESLYGISRKYNVTVDDLSKWNGLKNNDINVGQKLIVKIDSKQVKNTEEAIVVGNNDTEQIEIQESPTNLSGIEDSVFYENPLKNFERKDQRGMAALIEGSNESSKYLALHRDAPKGTILTVRNELNNQVVFVRVIGPLPDTGVNDRVIVKISKIAWTKLGAVNNRFRVKVSYIL